MHHSRYVELRAGDEFVLVEPLGMRLGRVSQSNCGFAFGSEVKLPRGLGWREASERSNGSTRITPYGLRLVRCVPRCGHPECEAVRKREAMERAFQRCQGRWFGLRDFIRVYESNLWFLRRAGALA